MRVHLAHPDHDLDVGAGPTAGADTLATDLGLQVLLHAMAGGDQYLADVAGTTLMASLQEPGEIGYRQAVLSDVLQHTNVVRGLYDVAVTALGREREFWIYSKRSPESLLRRSTALMRAYVEYLRQLREMAREHSTAFTSPGFQRLFAELLTELDDAYLASVDEQLRRLQFRGGIILSATLGTTNLDTRYTLRRRAGPRGWRERIGLEKGETHTWELDPRDAGGAEALEALRGRGIALAARAIGESADHVRRYFAQLRAELAFYLGCSNLRDRLEAKGLPTCFPEPVVGRGPTLEARGLYDPSLSLVLDSEPVVGSDVEAKGTPLLVITGANRGGKSTFLRSLGLAQLMMQAGMFVAADAFRADLRCGVFTHFKQEEDRALRSGKLDEELARMSAIVDQLCPGSLVLLNESFAATNEREGAEIGCQIVRALLENGVKVGYVTHMFDLATRLQAEHRHEASFLRAERLPDGTRTFRIVAGEALPTSHGRDLYGRIFADEPAGDGPAAETKTLDRG